MHYARIPSAAGLHGPSGSLTAFPPLVVGDPGLLTAILIAAKASSSGSRPWRGKAAQTIREGFRPTLEYVYVPDKCLLLEEGVSPLADPADIGAAQPLRHI